MQKVTMRERSSRRLRVSLSTTQHRKIWRVYWGEPLTQWIHRDGKPPPVVKLLLYMLVVKGGYLDMPWRFVLEFNKS